MKGKMVYYYAYGSNVNPEKMKNRKVDFTLREWAKLEHHSLCFNKAADRDPEKEGYANIEQCQNSSVEGAVYEINEDDIKILDSYEGVPKHYKRIKVDVITKKYGLISANTYIANHEKIKPNLKPKKSYLFHLLAGSDIFSPEYYEKLTETKTLD